MRATSKRRLRLQSETVRALTAEELGSLRGGMRDDRCTKNCYTNGGDTNCAFSCSC